MIMCFVIAGVTLVYDRHAWVIIIVGVILVYKELTMSDVPKCTDNNKPYGGLLIFTQCMLRFSFQFKVRFHQEPSLFEPSDPHGYVITTSINCRDR